MPENKEWPTSCKGCTIDTCDGCPNIPVEFRSDPASTPQAPIGKLPDHKCPYLAAREGYIGDARHLPRLVISCNGEYITYYNDEGYAKVEQYCEGDFRACARYKELGGQTQDATAPNAQAGTCRVCGCTDDHACETESGIPCAWLEPDLCSNCVTFSCARPGDACPHCKTLGAPSQREPSYPSCADCEQLRWDEKRQELVQEAAPTGDAAVDPNAFDAAAKLAIEKGWLREVPVPPAEAQPSDPPEPDSQPAPASEKKPRQKRSKLVPAKEQPVQETPALVTTTGDPLTDAIAKIKDEMRKSLSTHGPYNQLIGDFLLRRLDAHPEDTGKILATGKTIAGSQNEMRKEAEKHRSGSYAIITDAEGFAIVLKYFGIDGAAPPRPAAPVIPEAAIPAPAQKPQKPAIDFDVSLDDLL